MNDRLTDVLEEAAGPVPPAPPVLTLVKAGQRRRRRRLATGSVSATAAAVAMAVGLVNALPIAQPQIEPMAPTSLTAPAPNVVQATDGQKPVLASDAAPVDVDLRLLEGLASEVRLAAVASDGRVAVSATRRDLKVAPPDGSQAAQLSIPETIDRCESIAFDATGDLWAFCHATSSDPDTYQASLLRYPVGDVEPASYDVTDLVRKADATAMYARLWVEDGQVRAVVPTSGPPTDEGPSAPADAVSVTLIDGGEVQAAESATVTDLPPLPIGDEGWVSATGGLRTIGTSSAGSSSLQISWLTYETTVSIDTPSEQWDLEGVRFDSAFVGSTLAGTYYLSSAERTVVYGIAADGQGTTSVMRLPANAQGMPGLPDRPGPSPATLLLPAPDGSIHVVTADESGLSTAQVLPATS